MGLFTKKPPTVSDGRRRPTEADKAAAQPKAFSYYAKRTRTESAGGREPALQETNKSKIVGVLAFLIVGIALSSLFGKPVVQQQTDETHNYFIHQKETYTNEASEIINDSSFNKNKLTIDKNTISARMKHQFPELKTVTVKISFISPSPTIVIKPYRSAFIITTLDNAAYVLNENGRVLLPVSQTNGPVTLLTIQDKSGLAVRSGEQAMTSSSVAFIETVIAIFETSDIKPSRIVLPASAEQIDMYLIGAPYFIKFNLQEDPKQQAGAFLALKTKLHAENTAIGEYVDVRVPERAYIR